MKYESLTTWAQNCDGLNCGHEKKGLRATIGPQSLRTPDRCSVFAWSGSRCQGLAGLGTHEAPARRDDPCQLIRWYPYGRTSGFIWYDGRAPFADSDEKCGPEGDPLRVTAMKYPHVFCMVHCSSMETSSPLKFLAVMVRPSWNHHVHDIAEGRRQNDIVTACHSSIISCWVEQPGLVDRDDHEHALCVRGL